MADKDYFQKDIGKGGRLYDIEVGAELYQLVRALRKTPERLDKQLRADFRQIAERVRDEARTRAEGARPPKSERIRKTPQHWKQLVNSIKSGAESTSPFVVIGSDKVPWAIGHEWGTAGKVDSLGRTKEGKWPVATKKGYLLWGIVNDRQYELRREIDEAVERLFENVEDGA